MTTQPVRKNRPRRSFLKLLGTALVSGVLPSKLTGLSAHAETRDASSSLTAARGVVQRLLGAHTKQMQLQLLPASKHETFHISGVAGHILVEGSTASALLMGVHWYLKYVAGVSTSWNGDCLNLLPATLPAPAAPITQQTKVRHRFALNDTNDGYTCPYWTWEQWERQIDTLALHGINEVLVYIGAEAVYQQAFRKFHYTAEELRSWFPTPAHQPWWLLLQNMSGWVGPSVSQQLIDARLALAARITRRLRELE